MTSGELVITAYITFLSAGLGTLFWARMNRLEDQLSPKASAQDLEQLRADVAQLRAEAREDSAGLRRELAGVRSDLTQVALAVGAGRSTPSKG